MRFFKTETDRISPPSKPKTDELAVQDRRKEPRYVPIIDRACVGWWEGEDFRAEQGLLQNISGGGAAISVATTPVPDHAIWLCVIGPKQTAWVAGHVVGTEGNVLRLAFVEKFPYELFKTVVWGFPSDEATPPPAADELAERAENSDPVAVAAC